MRHVHHEASTTEHRDKRLFQPAITHYFSPRDARWDSEDSASDSDSTQANNSTGRGPGPITRAKQQYREHPHILRTDNETCFPQVPGSVQASLLSVGMRVRKAVPEGYKTLKSSNGTALPSIQTTLYSSKTATATETYTVKPPGGPVEDGLQHQRELLPFCGLHKIGGFAEQPVTNVHLYDPNGDKPLTVFPLPAEAFNQPFPSQPNAYPSRTELVHPSNNKRSFRDDFEDSREIGTSFNLGNGSGFAFKIPLKVSEDEVPVSPLSETPRRNELSSQPTSAPLRPFAQPRARKNNQPGVHSRLADCEGALYKEGVQDVDMQFENAQGRDEDFDEKEADFLRPWSGGAKEVEMSGV